MAYTEYIRDVRNKMNGLGSIYKELNENTNAINWYEKKIKLLQIQKTLKKSKKMQKES